MYELYGIEYSAGAYIMLPRRAKDQLQLQPHHPGPLTLTHRLSLRRRQMCEAPVCLPTIII